MKQQSQGSEGQSQEKDAVLSTESFLSSVAKQQEGCLQCAQESPLLPSLTLQ